MATNQKYATFYLNDICFGVPIEKVQEVLEFQDITPVPLSPAVLPGIINLRGQILTTIDLKTRLELEESQSNGQPMMIVVRTSEGQMNLVVENIGGVRDVDSALLEKPTETLKPGLRAVTMHLCKIEGNLLLVLDTEKIIQLPNELKPTERLEVSLQKQNAPAQ